jgi:hypothetical protein
MVLPIMVLPWLIAIMASMQTFKEGQPKWVMKRRMKAIILVILVQIV